MSKDRQRYETPGTPSRRRRLNNTLDKTLVLSARRPLPEVAIIPGNRFFLVPLKKVTALLRSHAPCRETATKPCIVSGTKRDADLGIAKLRIITPARETRDENPVFRQMMQSSSPKLISKHKRRKSYVAKTRLSPVSEQVQAEFLLDDGFRVFDVGSFQVRTRVEPSWSRRARDTSVFSLHGSLDGSLHGSLDGSFQKSCRRGGGLSLSSSTSTLVVAAAASSSSPSSQTIQELDLSKGKKKRKKKLSSSLYNESDMESPRYRSGRKTQTKTRFSGTTSTEVEGTVPGGRSFGRNNRVSPSSLAHGQQLLPASRRGETGIGKADELETSEKKRSYSRGNRTSKFNEAVVRDKKRNCFSGMRCSHKLRSRSPFLCSFTNEDDLPIGPLKLPRHLRKKGFNPAVAN